MRLLITDLTEMHGGNFCVAGWDVHANRMIRPLPNGANWTAPLLQQHRVNPGATIEVWPTGIAGRGAYPHATEDTPVSVHNIQFISAGPVNWFGPNMPAVSPSLAAAFGGMLNHNNQWNGTLQGVHVAPATRVNSLGALRVPSQNLSFNVNNFGSLRAVLNDGRSSYDLAVSSHRLKTAWRQGQIPAIVAALPMTQNFHVRIGLARAFGNPSKCYAMLNDVHG